MAAASSTSQTSQASSAVKPVPITVARGDGIGPDIMDAALLLLREAGAALEIDEIEVGRNVYERGNSAGIEPDAWDSLRRTGILFKAPITTPQGKGYKSLNVTIRKDARPVRKRSPLPDVPPVHSDGPSGDGCRHHPRE
jgi:isocitrate dehydrogenase